MDLLKDKKKFKAVVKEVFKKIDENSILKFYVCRKWID